MVDFFKPARRIGKNCIEVYPEFEIKKSSDLMIKGGDFYAIWLEDKNFWSTDEDDLNKLIDKELDIYARELRKTTDESVKVLYMRNARSGSYDVWHKYCTKQMRENYHELDSKLIFENEETVKKDYSTHKLPYPLAEGSTDAYDELMNTLYSPEEKHKIEWAIGAIVNGDSTKIQKFLVLYGASGTGKSTVLNIIQELFDGYYCTFDAKALGQTNNTFALEPFKDNPLVAIQHDGDLSHIEDNTRLNSVVSHEIMTVNEKYTKLYSSKFKCFLFMGTNRPVKITDAKSGIIRRLIDVTPTGNLINGARYRKLIKNVEYELGAIAYHCLQVYNEAPHYYDNYIPINMLSASNPFYNFIEDHYFQYKNDNKVTLKNVYEEYKNYCDSTKLVALPRMIIKEELKNYFEVYKARHKTENGMIFDYYEGFLADKFDNKDENIPDEEKPPKIIFQKIPSLFDKEFADCPAQYELENGQGVELPWSRATTTLKDLDTSRIHYVLPQEKYKKLIMIDFDILGPDGEKSFERNLEEASKWPSTYAELSKSGKGIHLLYLYTGDLSKLESTFANHIEIKKFTGKSAMRRKLTLCNDIPIMTLSSGLPLKGEKEQTVNYDIIKDEQHLRSLIKKNLKKEIHPATKPSIDFIFKLLEDAYNSGMQYDVTDMRSAISAFATNSTNNANYCIKQVNKMHFKSEDKSVDILESNKEIVFFDVEVFPNLFIVCWKKAGENEEVVKWFNPTVTQLEVLFSYKLIGFNNKRYDNYILYAWYIGYTNAQLFELSNKIINNSANVGFRNEAANISYTDVYDFSSVKQSLKKFEIELGIFHQEWAHKWNEPVPDELWEQAAEYCANDVRATEAVFNARHTDFVGREILANLSGLTVNDSTNSQTTRMIFGSERHPQSQFNYRNMGDESQIDIQGFAITQKYEMMTDLDGYTAFDKLGRPIFPGYVFEKGVSTYRGEQVGEGGYVYAEPGMYQSVALLDIASMHPSSIVAENLFGDRYTSNFNDILEARIAIKHKDFDRARKLYGGKMAEYLTDENSADQLSQALKIPINSVYGLTSASFDNPCRDPRNIDNIVAKRGALFMINLKHEVQKRGFTVAHIKTDSIKIPNATNDIIEFVTNYGKMYGYNFEHEATYERMCLVNDAVYICKYEDAEECFKRYGYYPTKQKKKEYKWEATGAQFQVPYVFKKLFTNEEIEFNDMCETKSVTTALYLDMNENLPEDQHNYVFVGRVGRFCPIMSGCGGGLLMREKDGKYSFATGSKGYRWLESATVKQEQRADQIDIFYYEKLVEAAKRDINKYGDFDSFVSGDSIDDKPPWED